jgi:MFS family permease
MFGDSLMLIVMGMWVKTLTHSNGAAGLTFLWMLVPSFFSPLLGYLIDRVSRRRFLVIANIASAVLVLPLLLVHDASDVWIVYVVAFFYGLSFTVVPAALNGLLKDMLAEDLLVDANASLSVTREGLRLVGPLLGATFFALLGGGAVAIADAATMLIAAAAIGSLRVAESHTAERAGAPEARWRTEVVAGVTHIRRTPLLLHSTLALALCLLVLGFSESAIYAVVDAFHKPVQFVGPLLTLQGVGALVGGLLSSRVVRRLGEPVSIIVGLVCLGAGLGGIAAAADIWELLLATVILGAGIPVLIVAYNTMLQKVTPGRLMGRVSAATDVLTTTPQALSIALGALLVTLVDYRMIFLVMAVGTLMAAGYLIAMLRRLPHRAVAPAGPGGTEKPGTGSPGGADQPEAIPGTLLTGPLDLHPGPLATTSPVIGAAEQGADSG